MDWLNLLGNCGSLGVLVFIVIKFLEFITARDKLIAEIHKECEQKLAAITTSYSTVMTNSIAASKDLEKSIALLKEKLESM